MGEQVGKTFVFDYGEFAVRVEYLSEKRLAWEQVQGPAPGLKGEEAYGLAEIRPGISFIWWQEKDTSVVAQVVDFRKKTVRTTWISPEKKVEHFQGTIRPTER